MLFGLTLLPAFSVIPEDRRQILEKLGEQKRLDNFEVLLRRSNGEPACVLMSVCLIPFDGRRSAFVALQDITGMRETEKALRKSELDKKEFLVSEEMRRKIGRDLHDGLGQILTAVKYKCSTLVANIRIPLILNIPKLKVFKSSCLRR
jgi:signal transduction histidine kinase